MPQALDSRNNFFQLFLRAPKFHRPRQPSKLTRSVRIRVNPIVMIATNRSEIPCIKKHLASPAVAMVKV